MIGGPAMNLVPRQGGNTFSGSFFGAGATPGFASSNYTAALKAQGLEVVAETNYQRNVPYETSMKPQVDALLAAKADAVIAVGAYTQCAAFIRDARAAGFQGPIADVSFVGADPLLRSKTRAGLVATARERWSWEGVARGVIAAARRRSLPRCWRARGGAPPVSW